MRSRTYRLLLLSLLSVHYMAQGQETEYDSLFQTSNATGFSVYKPIVSFSYGVLNFLGDVRNSDITTAIGNDAYQINLATFIDRQQNFTANFFYLNGKLDGNSYSHTEPGQNLNFQSEISVFGANVEYRFGHWIDKQALVRPYISLGVGNLNFNAKGDLTDANGQTYYYWTDGSIRDIEQTAPGPSNLLYRDYEYETDLRTREEQEFGLGQYSQRSLILPLSLGAHFRISQRAFFSLGVSYHYAFTDLIDNVAYKGTSVQGARGNDSYLYSHLSFHFDLFSGPPFGGDGMYGDSELDPVLFDDEDEDLVFDISDRCPGTPFGVEVDSLGCPFDSDRDGVPDYLDEEPDTRPEAWVDEQGVTVSMSAFEERMQLRNNAMKREDVEEYLDIIRGEYQLEAPVEIPEIFAVVDADGDGYLSFDELILAIDMYFDSQIDMGLDDLRDLNNFFFAQ